MSDISLVEDKRGLRTIPGDSTWIFWLKRNNHEKVHENTEEFKTISVEMEWIPAKC